MYKQIADALRIHGITDQSPKDYLSFFCLGNMETQTEGEYVPSEKLDDKSDYKQAQVHRRFMIYVHAKMMIGTKSVLNLAPHIFLAAAPETIFISESDQLS